MGWRWKPEKGPDGRRGVEPDPAAAETVKLIVRMFLDGASTRGIARELMARGVPTAKGSWRWHRKLVVDTLRQPLHYGLVRVEGDRFVQAEHFAERHFDPTDLERVNDLLAGRTAEKRPFAMRPEYLLTGLVTCGHCGKPCRARQGRGRLRTYQCQSDECDRRPVCSRNNCRAEWVEPVALEHVRALVEHPVVHARARQEAEALFGEQRRSLSVQRDRLRANLEQNRDQAVRMMDMVTRDLATEAEYREFITDLRERRSAQEERLAEVEAQLAAESQGIASWQRIIEALQDVGQLWERMTAEERRDLLGEVVEQVEMTRTPEGGTDLQVRLRTGTIATTAIPDLRNQALTPRQMATVWLAGQGLDRSAIAARLGITPEHVNTLLCGARRRLGASSRPETIARGAEVARPYVPWLDLEGREQRVRRPEPSWPTATQEERRVLELIADGLNGPQVAERLEKSPNTVYVQLRNLRQKLGAANNTQLLRFAREAGMLPGGIGLPEAAG
jgi:DNA-binding CsgD family transcriptional regulator